MFGKHSVHYVCPKCGERLKSPLADAGKQDSCPDCRALFVVPGEQKRRQIEEAQLVEKREREAAAARRKLGRREQKAERRQEKAKRYWENQQRKLKQHREQERRRTATQHHGTEQRGRQSPPDNVKKQYSTLEQSRDFVRKKFFQIHAEYMRLCREKYFNNASVKFEQTAWANFESSYASKYGEGARAYLNKTIYAWQNGWTGMSGQTMSRILECVPPFLEIDEQFKLLSFFAPPALSEQFHGQQMALSEIADCYNQIAHTVKCKEYELPWFVRDVFSAEEITEFLNVFKFTMIDGLRQSYHDVRNDLVTLRKTCAATDAAIDVQYQIALLDYPLDIDTCPTSMPPSLDIAAPEPRLVTEFRQQYRQVLLEHVVQARATIRTGDIRQRIALSDVAAVIRQLQRTKSDQEYESTLAVEGRGGDFTVRFEKKNPLRLQYAIAVESVKLGIVVTISAALALWSIAEGLWPLLYFVALIAFSLLSAIWTKLQSLRWEVMEYEGKRRTGVATARH